MIYTESDELKAMKLGMAAFAKRIDAPALDPALIAMIKPLSLPGECLPLLYAWRKGWKMAHSIVDQIRDRRES
jgi:hypothetical protein